MGASFVRFRVERGGLRFRMMPRVGIEQPPDHTLILGMMFPRLTLVELNVSFAQRKS